MDSPPIDGDAGRRPGWFRCWVVRPLLWGLTAVALLVFVLQPLLDTRSVRDTVRVEIAEYLSKYFGRRVDITDLTIDLVPLSVEVWGFTVHGPPEAPDALFLHVPFAAAESNDILGLYRREVHLSRVRVERPEVDIIHLLDGTHNIVSFRSKKPRKRRRWDVYIDRLEVDRSKLFIDQERIDLSISADAVQTRMEGLGELHMAGRVVAQNTIVRLPNARPLPVTLAARGQWQRGRVDVEEVVVSGRHLEVLANGSCEWARNDPTDRSCRVNARGQARGSTLEALDYFSDLEGAFEFDGVLDWEPQRTDWRGEVRGRELQLWGRGLTDVVGDLRADRSGARFEIRQAQYADGSVVGDVTYDAVAEGRPLALDLNFEGVHFDTVLADQNIPVHGTASRVDGHLTYGFVTGGSRRGNGLAEVNLVADLALPGIPFEGAFPLRIDDGVVRLEKSTIQSSRQAILSSGLFDLGTDQGQFDFEVASADLSEILPLMPTGREVPPPLWLPSEGRGKFGGTLFVVPGEVATDLWIDLEDVVAPSGTTRWARGSMFIDESATTDLRLELGDGREALTVRGQIPASADDPRAMELTFDAYDWPMEAVHPWLDFDLPFDGRVSGRMRLESIGGVSTGEMVGTLSPAIIRLGVAPDKAAAETLDAPEVAVDTLSTRLTWDAEGVDFERFDLEATSGQLRGVGTYRWDDAVVDASFESDALDLAGDPLRQWLPREDIQGLLATTARLVGPLDAPRLEVDLTATDLALGGQRLGERPSNLQARWQGGRVSAQGRLLDLVSVAGTGVLEPGRALLDFKLVGGDVGGLLELTLEEPPQVEGEFRADLRYEQENDAPAVVDLTFDDVDLLLRGVHRIENLEPVVTRLGAEAMELEVCNLLEPSTGSEFFLKGTVDYGEGAPLDLLVQATMDGKWLEYMELGFDVGGRLDLLGRLGGTFDGFTFDGQGEFHDATFSMGDFPYRIERVDGLIELFPEGMVIEGLEGELALGTVAMSGRVDYPPDDGPLDYRLQSTARDLNLRYPEGWRLFGDLDLVLRSAGNEGHVIDGRATLSDIEFIDDIRLDFEKLMRGFLQRQRLEVAPTDSLLSAIAFNVDIVGPDALRIRNNLADLGGSADLVLRGNMAEPVLYGEVELAEGGKLIYNNTEYELERGRILFRNPYALDPEVDILATTRVRDFDVTLALDGTFEQLETRFSSEPPLPDLEVFRLLATGEDLVDVSTSASNDDETFEPRLTERSTEDPSTSAAVFLYGQAASVIGDRVNRLFGFDKFRIDPLVGSGDNLSKARVTVGKRLSKDVFVTYSVDPTSTENQRLQVEWQVSPGLVLVLTQNGDDTYSADARWESVF